MTFRDIRVDAPQGPTGTTRGSSGPTAPDTNGPFHILLRQSAADHQVKVEPVCVSGCVWVRVGAWVRGLADATQPCSRP